jgi:Methyltransferase domain
MALTMRRPAVVLPQFLRRWLGGEASADFYSSIPSVAEVERSFEYRETAPPFANAGLFDERRLAEHLAELCEFAAEFTPAMDGDREHCRRFFWNNGQFGFSDAVAYYCMVRRYRPATIVEVGSGFSTLIAAEALARNGSGRLVCVEPYPRGFLAALPGIECVRELAQDLELRFFQDHLADGDMLVIDSTHTVKSGSDCVHLYLRVLPNLGRDVLVHAHDVFLPHPMPKEWLLEQRLFWTEQYLLLALMIDNPRVEVLYGSAFHNNNPATKPLLERMMAGKAPTGGGSLWLRYRGRQAVPSMR